MRIGIDVGGTHTDAALVDGERVIATAKTPTTAGVSEGIEKALRRVLVETDAATVEAVMIGTTHFTNAVIEGTHLQETACVRLGLPATASLPPMVDWPNGLRERDLGPAGRDGDVGGGQRVATPLISSSSSGEISRCGARRPGWRSRDRVPSGTTRITRRWGKVRSRRVVVPEEDLAGAPDDDAF